MDKSKFTLKELNVQTQLVGEGANVWQTSYAASSTDFLIKTNGAVRFFYLLVLSE